jgi:hypothetical protein
MYPGYASTGRRASLLRVFYAALCAVLSWLFVSSAAAQIERPGAHPQYAVELEPHGLIQWDVEPWNDEGLGLGFRASIPVMQNGPVTTINNSFAVGFGLDWAYSDGNCYWRAPPVRYEGDCDTHNFSFPVVAQWNFFFNQTISAFAEFGLTIIYATWDWDYPTTVPGDWDEDDIDVDPVFLIGPRFILGDKIAIPIRIGWPYLSVGVSFLV